LAPIREKRSGYEKNRKVVEEILFEGTEKARKIAKKTLEKVKESMRLRYF